MGWLSGWSYRVAVEITGSSSGAVSDYQIRFTIYYGSGTPSGEKFYCNQRCKPDFGDIRFTASDGVTLLPYWMEEKVDGDYAVFWVKIPSIPASPNKTTIYIYYGNPNATHVGDGYDTFMLYNDGELAGWSYAKASVSDGEVVLDPDGANPAAYLRKTNISFNPGVRLRARINFYPEYGGWKEQGVGLISSTSVSGSATDDYSGAAPEIKNGAVIIMVESSTGQVRLRIGSGGSITDTQIGTLTYANLGIYRKFEIRWVTSRAMGIVDDQYSATRTTGIPTIPLYVHTWYQRNGAGTVKVDWLWVGKYIDPEPTISAYGSEETPPPPAPAEPYEPEASLVSSETTVTTIGAEAYEPESSLISSEVTVTTGAEEAMAYEPEASLISSEATVAGEEAPPPPPPEEQPQPTPTPTERRGIPWWIWLLLLGAGAYVLSRIREELERRRR